MFPWILNDLLQFLNTPLVHVQYEWRESSGLGELLSFGWVLLCQILVGSSMGGWLMLLACLERPERVAGVVGIATAADHFVTAFNQLPSEARMEAAKTGVYTRQTRYIEGGVYAIQYGFVKEAEEHCILQSSIDISCPVRLIHSMKDEVVPWQTSIKVAEQLASDDVDVILRKGGEHRMSQSDDIKLLVTVVEDLLHRVTKKEPK
ncbi:hypothetical protein scyTo_0013933 [Scyliorhinus torazame]|uniref:Peptidase S9 prolyl oligopeptidase catalytic domain-containing protein n=1 Tax=Scyliorhinus torazame TaxID=75743 RepID=A0A401P7W1_SCYTO|nr:hypothetical protein [Scyliorhinus torazame]